MGVNSYFMSTNLFIIYKTGTHAFLSIKYVQVPKVPPEKDTKKNIPYKLPKSLFILCFLTVSVCFCTDTFDEDKRGKKNLCFWMQTKEPSTHLSVCLAFVSSVSGEGELMF